MFLVALSIITEKQEASEYCTIMLLSTQKECHLILLNGNTDQGYYNLLLNFVPKNMSIKVKTIQQILLSDAILVIYYCATSYLQI